MPKAEVASAASFNNKRPPRKAASNGCVSLERHRWRAPVVELSVALVTFGGTQLPLMIDGLLSSGQYKRNIKMNLSAGDGSQLDSLSTPGELLLDVEISGPVRICLQLLSSTD